MGILVCIILVLVGISIMKESGKGCLSIVGILLLVGFLAICRILF